MGARYFISDVNKDAIRLIIVIRLLLAAGFGIIGLALGYFPLTVVSSLLTIWSIYDMPLVTTTRHQIKIDETGLAIDGLGRLAFEDIEANTSSYTDRHVTLVLKRPLETCLVEDWRNSPRRFRARIISPLESQALRIDTKKLSDGADDIYAAINHFKTRLSSNLSNT